MTRLCARAALSLVPLLAVGASRAPAQNARVRDLVLTDAAPTTRLMGFGLVAGLNGTGDRVTGSYGSRQTVQSIVNVLRRFDVEVPAEVLRTRNVAAVLVTAEVSPYLRPGGRFDVHVSSLGDAQSLVGGILWMTPLVAEAGGKSLAAAQGALLGDATDRRRPGLANGSTAGRIPDGGVLEAEMARPAATLATKLLLRNPDMQTATRIAEAIDSAFGGPGNATVEDPGSVALTLKDTSTSFLRALAKVRELRIRTSRAARIIIDSRDGTIVAGGDLLVGEAVVSHGGITLSIGASADTATTPGDVRIATGTSVQRVASALHTMRATPAVIAAILHALCDVGALPAEVVAR